MECIKENITIDQDGHIRTNGRYSTKKITMIHIETGSEKTFESSIDACNYLGFKSTGRFSQYLTGDLPWPKKTGSLLSKWKGYYIDPSEYKETGGKKWDQWTQSSEDKFINSLSPDCLRGYMIALRYRINWGSLIPDQCLKTAKKRLTGWG